MGAYTRLVNYLNGLIRAKMYLNPLGAMRSFANELYKVVPGLTIGPTQLVAPLPAPPVYIPVDNGERDGEFYLSSDQTPTLVWVWRNGNWVGLSGESSGSTTYTLPIASAIVLGGVKVGTTLTIDGSGVLNTLAAGADTQVQFNDATALAGSSLMTFNKTSGLLTLGGTAGLSISGVASGANAIEVPTGARIKFGTAPYLFTDNQYLSLAGATGFIAPRALVAAGGYRTSVSGGPVNVLGRITAGSGGTAVKIGNELAVNATDKILSLYTDVITTEKAYFLGNGAMHVIGTTTNDVSISIPTNSRLAFDGTSGTAYLTWNGASIGTTKTFAANAIAVGGSTGLYMSATNPLMVRGRVTVGGGSSTPAIKMGNINGTSAGDYLTTWYSDSGMVTPVCSILADGSFSSLTPSGSVAVQLLSGARLKLGGGTDDYLYSDGTDIVTPARHHYGLVWDDAQVSVTNAIGAGGLATVTFRDTPAKMLAFSDTGSDNLTFYCQMPHKWDTTTSVKPHIHWVPRIAVSGASTVIFTGQYTWAAPNGVIPANASWTTFTQTVNLVPGDEYIHKITSLATVAPPSPAAASDILIVALNRDGATDTYNDGTNNVGVLSLDVHYQSSLLGTVSEF